MGTGKKVVGIILVALGFIWFIQEIPAYIAGNVVAQINPLVWLGIIQNTAYYPSYNMIIDGIIIIIGVVLLKSKDQPKMIRN